MKLLGISLADENSPAGKDSTASGRGKKVHHLRDSSVRRVCPGGDRGRWWQYCRFTLIGLFFICVAMPWIPSWVSAQSPPENVARQTKNITIMTLEGQTINRDVTCEMDFNTKKWRMVFQRPLDASPMTTQISVHQTVLQTFPLHSAPEGWQTLELSPELEQYLFSEGIMFTVGAGGAVQEYKFLLISRGLAKLVEYEVHPVFESEYKDAQGRSPVFIGDPVRVHYVFSRDLPPEANAMLSCVEGEKMPLRLEGEGDFVFRLPSFASGMPLSFVNRNADLAEAVRLCLYFHLPQSVTTSEGLVKFDPYRNYPEIVGVATTAPKMYIYRDAVRDDDVPAPVSFTSEIIVTTGNEPDSWFFSFPQADPKDMLVTTNQGKVMQARRLGELTAYHSDGKVPHYELFFGDVSKYSVLTVGILKVDTPRPFAGVSIPIPTAMRDHYAEIGRKIQRLPPILCQSSPAYSLNPPLTITQLPPDISIPMTPPPSNLPPNPNRPGIVPQYRFDLEHSGIPYHVTVNEPVGFYVWLPTHIIQALNQQAPPEWHLSFPHATRLASFPQGAWYRIFIDYDTSIGSNNHPPEDNIPRGAVSVSIGALIWPLSHPQLPILPWVPTEVTGDGSVAVHIFLGTQLMGQSAFIAEWNRGGGSCGIPILSTPAPAPSYRSYGPAPYGRAPYLPFAQYIKDAEATVDYRVFGSWDIAYQIAWHMVPETPENATDWWYEVTTRSLVYRYTTGVDLVLEGFAPYWILDRNSGKIGRFPLSNGAVGSIEYAQIIGYHKSQMHSEDRRITGLGCPSADIEVSANPTEVSGQEPVEITINSNGNFFYGIIEGGVEPITFQSPGTYQVMVPEGSGELLLRVVFYGSTLNCNPVIKEITIERGPLSPSKWRISAMEGFPAIKEPVPDNGCYWEGPSYTAGIPVLKALSRTYQKLYGKNDICPLPQIPSRKGTSLFHEGMGTGVRQKDW